MQLYEEWKGKPAASVDLLPQSGSDRRYFRLHESNGGSVIATIGANTRENEVFIYFSNHLQQIRHDGLFAEFFIGEALVVIQPFV